MKYAEALAIINPRKALNALKIEGREDGAYIHFTCPECQGDAVTRAYGEKKNIWLCTKCKVSGHIISLAMKLQGLEYEEAKQFLLEHAQMPVEIDSELNLNYEVEFCNFMEEQGLNKEVCDKLEIGKPLGKTMLSGCVAFKVINHNGLKVAYVGLKISTRKSVIPKQFNPESTLYNICNINPDEEVILTPDMLDCAKLLSNGQQAISNFWLPYLSRKQLDLLQTITYLSVTGFGNHTNEIALNLANLRGGYFRFV